MLSRSLAALVLALPALTAADVITGRPDAAPAGFEQWTSEIVLPSKNISGDGSWAAATAKAKAFVAQLTLDEKINVTTGTDIFNRCLGNTGVSHSETYRRHRNLLFSVRPSPVSAGAVFAFTILLSAFVLLTLSLLCMLFLLDNVRQ
jgi:hypothetical protein